MKKIGLCVCIIISLVFLSGCQTYYDMEWIIGKNSTQIIEKYGEFDDYIIRDYLYTIEGHDVYTSLYTCTMSDANEKEKIINEHKNIEGLLVDCEAYYIVEHPKLKAPFFFSDMTAEVQFVIQLDKDGVAVRCYETEWQED